MSFRKSASDILDELRHLSNTTHPHLLNELGLKLALESLLQRALVSQSIMYACNIEVDECSRFVQQQLYRIVQELLSNTVKHANASEVLLNITQTGNSIQLLYKDDGVGIRRASLEVKNGFGIISIQERCKLIRGTLSFETDQPVGMRCSIVGIVVHGK